MNFKSDVELLAAIKNGSEEAFAYCYKSFLPMVRSWMQKNKGNREEADDLFQDGLMVVYDKVQKNDFELNAKFSTYLMAVCKYQWYNKQKANKEVGLHEDADQWMYANIETDLQFFKQKEIEYNALNNALEKLGNPCSDILKAYYFDNKSMQEISDEYDYTNANNAKTQKYKCLQRLKKIFNTETQTDGKIRNIQQDTGNS